MEEPQTSFVEFFPSHFFGLVADFASCPVFLRFEPNLALLPLVSVI
jgi:hypothetical protein